MSNQISTAASTVFREQSLNTHSYQMIVAKFGGTSVADFAAMSRCADIVLADPAIRLVVVSASSGVTNLLVAITKEDIIEGRFAHYTGIERITYAVLEKLQQLESLLEQRNVEGTKDLLTELVSGYAPQEASQESDSRLRYSV